VRHEPQLERPAEVHSLCGDASFARERLGWSPKVRFEELIRLMVQAEQDRLEEQ
jgi:GDPmannose 4,6-dehydratase